MRRVALLILVAVVAAHNAWWIWHREGLVWGLPFGLLWEIGYCIVATLALALAVHFAWPKGIHDEGGPQS